MLLGFRVSGSGFKVGGRAFSQGPGFKVSGRGYKSFLRVIHLECSGEFSWDWSNNLVYIWYWFTDTCPFMLVLVLLKNNNPPPLSPPPLTLLRDPAWNGTGPAKRVRPRR